MTDQRRSALQPPPRRRAGDDVTKDQRERLRAMRPAAREAQAIMAASTCSCELCRSRDFVGAVIDLVNVPVPDGNTALLILGEIRGLLLPQRRAEDIIADYNSLLGQLERAGENITEE